jgi:putative hydrolase of the HAD superfamily
MWWPADRAWFAVTIIDMDYSLVGYLAAVIVSVRVGYRKPHPAIYAAALAAVGAEPGATVFAGDGYRADYAGPLAVGIRAYLIDSTDQYRVPPNRRLRSLRDLPERLGI